MTQTLAIFLDAYRELNSRKLFWITLIISGMVVVIFALIGINEQGLRVLIWDVPVPGLNTSVISKETFYKSMFVNFGIGFWLAWLATILALVSTAGIFPDLITGGSIDLMLSKPIGRLRLFLTKYASGLLFVLLQVLVFCVASFLTLGIAGGAWEPGVFLAVPVMVVFFSYLFSVCTLLGLVTRSTIAALLLTLLCWFMMFAVGASETTMLAIKIANESRQVSLESQFLRQEENVGRVEGMGDAPGSAILETHRERAEELRGQLEAASGTGDKLDFAHGIMMAIKTGLPKTTDTIGLLERWMIDLAELPPPPEDMSQQNTPFGDPKDMLTIMEEVRGRSVWWVIGSSLLFETAILALASFLFVRRDF